MHCVNQPDGARRMGWCRGWRNTRVVLHRSAEPSLFRVVSIFSLIVRSRFASQPRIRTEFVMYVAVVLFEGDRAKDIVCPPLTRSSNLPASARGGLRYSTSLVDVDMVEVGERSGGGSKRGTWRTRLYNANQATSASRTCSCAYVSSVH